MAALERLPAGARVLEIGCGQGAFGARLAARFEYLGVELDAHSAAVARARVGAASSRAAVLHGSYEEAAGEAPFDAVCAFEVIEHIEDDRRALAEWKQLVRPGGRLVLSTPAHQHRMGPWDVLVGHYRRYDPGELSGLLKAVGFEPVEESMFGFPLGYLLEAVRDAVASRRRSTGTSTMKERTSASGRSLQPTERWGPVTRALALPFRYLQRPFRSSRLGTGMVVWGDRPK